MLRFNSLVVRPRHFHNFTGFKVEEFIKLADAVRPDWEEMCVKRLKADRIRKVGGGAKPKLLLLEDRLLLYSVYAKLYCSYLMLEYLFGIDESTVCRMVQEMSFLLGQKIIVQRSGKKITTLDELREVIPDLDEILVDATEQKIPRPQKKRSRKAHHSGKKKAFTMKTQIVTDRVGVVLHVSDSVPGRRHDYRLFQRSKVPRWLERHKDIHGQGDLGYLGVNKDYPQASFTIPHKRHRGKVELTRSEKIQNTKLAKRRIVIEHTFAALKKFRILAETYRNSKEHYSATFKSIVFLSNFRMLERMAG